MLHFTGNKQTVLKTKNKQTQKTNHKQYKMKKAKTKQIAPECFVFVSFSFLFVCFFAFFSTEKCIFGIPESPEEKKATKKKQKETNTKHSSAICFFFVFFIVYFVVVCFFLVCFLLFIVNTHIWSFPMNACLLVS